MSNTPPSYNVGSLRQMAEIPEEALPRFLAELPAILQTIRDVTEAAPSLAAQMKANAPWPLSLLPVSVFQYGVERAGERMRWIDDDKGMAIVSMSVRAGDEPFFRAEAKLGDHP